MKSEVRSIRNVVLIALMAVVCVFLTNTARAQREPVIWTAEAVITHDATVGEKGVMIEPAPLRENELEDEEVVVIHNQDDGGRPLIIAPNPIAIAIDRSDPAPVGLPVPDSAVIGIEPIMISADASVICTRPADTIISSSWNLDEFISYDPSVAFGAPERTQGIFGYNSFANYSLNYTNNLFKTSFPRWSAPSFTQNTTFSFFTNPPRTNTFSNFFNQAQNKNQLQNKNQNTTKKVDKADVNLIEDNNGELISLNVGETVSILLLSNPTTGYGWELNDTLLDSHMIALESDQYLPPAYTGTPFLVGAGGYEQFIFQATGVGDTIIELNYKRSWSQEIADTFWVEISVESSSGAGGPAGIANPASVYCIENGGTLEMRTDEYGVYGVCMFTDGTECEEWSYFNGECGQ